MPRNVGRTEGFSFRIPITFYAVMEPDGFVCFQSSDKEKIETIRTDLCNGARASYLKEDVRVLQFTITDITPEEPTDAA